MAHNARFDRPFVERVLPAARARPWACTRAEVPWTAEGFASQALHCLLCAYGVYARDRHRALADCEAGGWLLAQRLPVSGDSVLAAMRRRALTPTVRLWAIRAPFESKEALRARGYRWMPEMRDGIERSWWTDVEPDEAESELAWLREAVYGGTWGYLPPGGIPQRRVTAFDRWRMDPSDLAHPAPLSLRAPSARPRGKPARPGLVPATRTSRARSRLHGGVPTCRVGVRSRSTRDSRASNSGCSPRFREISGARVVRATSRAAPLFGTASTRPRRPPDFPRARWLSSRNGSDTSGST